MLQYQVNSDNTDVFVLLVHYHSDKKLTSTLLMEPTSQGRSSANIGSTIAKHRSFAPQLLSAHALSGCDTVASYIALGKTKAVKVIEAENRLNHLGNPSANLEDVLCESTAFVAACYGQKCEACETMTDVRYKVWVTKTLRKGACLLPKLKAMSPTLEVFKDNIKRAHFQACIWKAALDEEPPNLDPVKFGWVKDDFAKSLCAVPLPQDVPLAPAELLEMIQCMCNSDQICSSLRCGCVSSQLPCSLFCKCGGSDSCCNQMTEQCGK